jgi:hypothetical protein
MAKRKGMSDRNSRPTLKKPWFTVTGILFGLLVTLTLFFIFYGMAPDIDSYVLGNIGISTQINSSGEVVLYPQAGRDAQQEGVENFDVLLRINGKLVNKTSDISAMLAGKVGEKVTIDVRKSDGNLMRYTIVRSSAYKNALEESGLSAEALAAIYVSLSVLIGLGFCALGAYLIWKRPTDILSILMAFCLVLLPYSVNAVRAAVEGVSRAHLEWLYTLLRVAGILSFTSLLFLFPSGHFVPRWTRWLLIGVAAWAALYYAIAIDPYFLPGALIVIAGYINYVWGVFVLIGLACQVYRYQRRSTENEGQLYRQVGIALLAATATFGLVWLLRNYLPPLIFSDGGWEWFNLVAELLVAAGFLYFGFNWMMGTEKAV